jgi:hypothetical protein
MDYHIVFYLCASIFFSSFQFTGIIELNKAAAAVTSIEMGLGKLELEMYI